MTSKRDHLFPSASIGRVQGTRLQRIASHETLAAHPLLSPNNTTIPSIEPAHNSTTGNTSNVNETPRYVPYTPRQRVTPTAVTTGMTVHPSVAASPQQYQGDATSKLQMMNLKAAAQNVGLDTGTVGWVMLEKLVSESDHSVEWTDIWNAITTGKATLMLPLEQASGQERFTVEFVKDHIVLCDGPSRKNAPIITLSGLRGVLDGERLTFRSSIHPSSKPFQNILNPSTRFPALSTLPALPLPISSTFASPYPTFSIPSYTSSLPLPPRAASPAKPSLPSRLQNRGVSSPQTGNPSRLSNPFASLFGKPTPTPTPAQVSPPASLHTPEVDHVVDISAFTIDRRIMRKDVGKDINKALKNEVKDSLAGLSSWVVERVHDFTAGLYPMVKASKRSPGTLKGEKIPTVPAYVVNAFEEAPAETSQRFQDFYGLLEQDLRLGGTPFLGRRREEQQVGIEAEKDNERRVQEKMETEAKIREGMEIVEKTICSCFYDRLYLQPTSDDLSHDEALSSRVAALNMLDLDLEHLDIHVDDMGFELDLVVKACGETLTQLEACRSPADKAAIVVAAHKIVVDGLSRLPPIRLKSEGDSDNQNTRQASLAEKPNGSAAEALPPPTVIPSRPPDMIKSEPEVSPKIVSSSPPIPTKHESECEPDCPPDPTVSPKHVTPPLPLSSSPVKAPSAPLTMSPPTHATPVSGDVLLPIIIFSVVKANPSHLVSNLLYTQRFRNQSIGGEQSYCLINIMAVAEFLENVDLTALGLGDSDKVMSTADLTPIPLIRNPITAETPLVPHEGLPGRLRGRVEQQVDAIAGSANKVITGVVDSSFGMLRSFLPNSPDPDTPAVNSLQSAAPWNSVRPGFGLLRRENGFSIANIAASLPIPGGKSMTKPMHHAEEAGQPLVTVSRPGSVKSLSIKLKVEEDLSSDGSGEERDRGHEEEGLAEQEGGDARSIQSFENMMNNTKRDRKGTGARRSLTDRLANMSSLAALKNSPPPSRRSSVLPPVPSNRFDTPASSRPGSPSTFQLPPPHQRFMECACDDLKLSEVGELLHEYRRLVEGVRAVGGFGE